MTSLQWSAGAGEAPCCSERHASATRQATSEVRMESAALCTIEAPRCPLTTMHRVVCRTGHAALRWPSDIDMLHARPGAAAAQFSMLPSCRVVVSAELCQRLVSQQGCSHSRCDAQSCAPDWPSNALMLGPCAMYVDFGPGRGTGLLLGKLVSCCPMVSLPKDTTICRRQGVSIG